VDLFTVIGLLLSVFGAAYSANAALRTHFEDKIRSGVGEASKKVKFIQANDIAGNAHATANSYADKIRIAVRIWTLAHWLPILIFSLTSFLLSLIVVFCKSQPQGQSVWEASRWVLLSVVALDLICFLTALGAYAAFNFANNPLTADYDSCVERKNRSEAGTKIEKPVG
jgi:hypothetical protein